MHTKNFRLIVILNVVITMAFILLFWKNYNDYQAMPGALNKEGFLYMIAIEVLALAGLVLLFFKTKTGLPVYIASLILLVLYPVITGTGDTVLGLLTLPVLIIPVVFILYYIRIFRTKTIHATK